MTHQEILEKAIRKAIDNGWQPDFDIKVYRLDINFKVRKPLEATNALWSAKDIIFNHGFARAIWGEELHPYDATKVVQAAVSQGGGKVLIPEALPNWQYHLQQMVIADDPVQYLEERTIAPKT